MFRKIRKEYFTCFNISPYERFFLIDAGATGFDPITLKDLVYLLIEKWSKCSQREKQSFCPYVYFHNISDKQLAMIKGELFREGLVFVDGFPFYMSDFYPDALTVAATFENKIAIKSINNIKMLEEVISKIHKKVEIYQFYINEIFYNGSDEVKHIKNIKEIV